ncbi:hypothetical protein AB0L65_57215 [Nonomuraea sp. NPDC052116]|uniref:hypothetical protein n=1 Tax=Nonomuraea sp. NPDC052116 TaxID=3155665 RepID=UPI00341E8D9A
MTVLPETFGSGSARVTPSPVVPRSPSADTRCLASRPPKVSGLLTRAAWSLPSRVTMRVSMGSQAPLAGFFSWTGRVYSSARMFLPSGLAQTFMVSVNRAGTSTD